MDNLKELIKEQIPKKTPILGFYDDEEERWVKAPNEEILTMIGLTIGEITPFVRNTIRQMKALDKTFNIEKVGFELGVQGNKIRFTVMLKKET